MASSSLATLIVYAYSSFTSSFGAGPQIVELFQKQCSCKVLLVNAGDAGSMISRLKLEGKKGKADIALGIDESVLWRVEKDLNWDVKNARAYDQAPLAFVYNSTQLKTPPHSLDDLLKPEFKKEIIVEDPRLSTVGLGFLLWVLKDRGEEKAWEYFSDLNAQLKMTTPGWDLAYGLFKKGKSLLVLSFWTSPAYHIQEEKNETFKAAAFEKGHYVQTEYVVVNSESKNKELASKFSEFLLSQPAQELLMTKNFMYPANEKVKLNQTFLKLGKVKLLKPFSQQELANNLEKWLKRWREIFSK